ncbi:MAG: DUF1648 domain-containing protein [Bacteroidota bacterium]|nr:DUF1648 domain-containing protein [Bacteroidota bacterium]MDX5504690.1 DUF1648 domain-containing protein [Bacteroidota bacterium]
MEDRPKIELSFTRWDLLLEALGWMTLIATWIVPMFYYSSLPERIPIHFNAAGIPDGFSQRGSLWIIAGINTFLYVGMSLLTKVPHIYNYSVDITPENAEFQYRNAVFMVRYLKTLVSAIFLYAMVSVIMVALGKWEGTGSWFLPVFIVLMMGSTVFFLVRASRGKRHKKTAQ